MRIRIDPLNPRSIANAIYEIEGLRKSMDKLAMELASRLAEIGLETAMVAYAGAEADGNADVNVTIEPTDRGYKLIAYGTDVFFVEFGTGVQAGNGYETDEITPPVNINPGSWSEQHNGPFYRKGYWWYGRRRYTGTRPYMGMYLASKAIKENVEAVAKEVFK